MRITRKVVSIAALAMALSGLVSRTEAAEGKKGLTLGGNIAYLMGGGLMYGPNLGYRTHSVDFIADAYWASATGVSVSLYRLNVDFNLGNFFIGPNLGLATVTIAIAGLSVSGSGLSLGGTVGYNIWLGNMFALTPVAHVAVIPAMLIDAGLQLSVTF